MGHVLLWLRLDVRREQFAAKTGEALAAEADQAAVDLHFEEVVERLVMQNLHFGAWLKGSRSYQEVQRNVLEPGDVRMLPYDEQLVFVTGAKPFRTRKLRFFEDPFYIARATDIRNGGRGPAQTVGPYVPQKGIRHDWQDKAQSGTGNSRP